MIERPTCDYAFVIDTEQYAGNFERELCAFITGKVGDCGVGQEAADIFNLEMRDRLSANAFKHLSWQCDDKGCARPVAIWPTPGWVNDGKGGLHKLVAGKKAPKHKYPAYMSAAIFFYQYPTKEEIRVMKERAMLFNARPSKRKEDIVTITGFRILRFNFIAESEDV